jgi:predicted permease
MQTILNVIVPIFSLIAIGFLMARAKLLPAATGDALARFVFVVAVPLLLFRTLATADFGAANPLLLWLAYFGAVAITWTAATLLVRRFTPSDHRRGVIAGISASFANTVFVAIPALQRAYGDAGLEPLLLIISIHLPVMMIASSLLIERAALLDARAAGTAPPSVSLVRTLARVGKNLATSALVIGILAGAAWRLTGLELESHLDEVTRLLAGTALALPPLWLKGAVITAASPVGVNAYLLAVHFGSGERLAATTILVSTVLSVITLSLWLIVLG